MPFAPPASLNDRRLARGRIWWFLAIPLIVILLLPLALVPIPPILDYPNHLARMFVLANGPSDPFLSKVYARQWDIIPNIGIDMIMPPMLSLMSVYTAGRIMLAIALLLPVLGTITYSRAVFRTRSAWPLASGLVAYNAVFLLGFMNFLIGVGAALCAAACWIRRRDTRPLITIAVMAVAATVIFFIHLFALALLGLLIATHELTLLWRQRRIARSLARLALQRFVAAVVVFALPAVLLLASPLGRTADVPAWGDPVEKLMTLLGPFSTYAWRTDLLAALLVAAIIATCLLSRHARLAPQAVLATVILLALYPFVPMHLDAAFIDTRLPIMAGFLVFAGFAPDRLPTRWAFTVTLSVSLVFLLRIAVLTNVWFGQNHDVADLLKVIAHVPFGSRVLVVSVPRSENTAYWQSMPRHRFLDAAIGVPPYSNLPGLLVTERDSIWPLLFTVPSKQPLIVRPAYRNITMPEGVVPSYRLLQDDNPPPDAIRRVPYLAHWTANFDYVLVMLAGGAQDLDNFRSDRLELLARTDIAALMRIKQDR